MQNKNKNENGRLAGQTAVVTGASRGIGRAIALKLASEGASVVINYQGSKERAEAVKAEIEEQGGTAYLYQCNVADFGACEEFLKAVTEQTGRLDILVNNAGITRDGLLMRMSEEDYDAVLNTNLKGTFHCIRFASRQMLKQKSGRIINISSVSGVLGNAGQANYSASKAGIIGLTKSAARELASRGLNHGQCDRAGICQHGNDGRPFRKSKGRRGGADSSGQIRRAGGYRGGSSLSGI